MRPSPLDEFRQAFHSGKRFDEFILIEDRQAVCVFHRNDGLVEIAGFPGGGGSPTLGFPVADIVLGPSGTVLYVSDPQAGRVVRFQLDPFSGWEPDPATGAALPSC